MNASQIETVYDCVVYQSSSGTLKLNEEHLSFHTDQKVSMLPWKKIVGRQVSSSHMKPMFKLVLKSGSEAIFQMQDRVSLEVVRDDLGERMSSWQTLHVVPPSTGSHEETVPAAFRTPRAQEHLKIPTSIRKGSGSEEVVNMTGNTVSERLSTPYRMVNPRVLSEVAPSKGKKQTKRRQSMPEQSTMKGKEANIKKTKEQSHQRRASCMGAPQVSGASSKTKPKPPRKSSINQKDVSQLALERLKNKRQTKRRQSMPEQSTMTGKEATTKKTKEQSQQRRASCIPVGAPQVSSASSKNKPKPPKKSSVNQKDVSELASAPSKSKEQTKQCESMPEQSTTKGKEPTSKQTKERSQQRRASSMGPPQVSSASSKAEPTPTRKSSVNQQDAVKAVTGQLASAQSKSKKQTKRRQSMPEQSTTKGKEATPKDGSPQRSASSMGPPRKPQRQGSSKKLDVSQETTGRSTTPRATKKATASSNKTTRRRSRRSSAPDFTTKSMRRSNVV